MRYRSYAPFILILLLIVLPSIAEAHAFTAGQGGYALFIEGVTLVFHTPELSLCILALGLMIGLWNVEGMPIVWLSLLAGSAVGLGLPFLVLADISRWLFALTLVLGTLAIMDRRYGVGTVRLVSAVSGTAIAYDALGLHGLASLPAMILVGLFVGINLIVPMIAGIATLPRRSIAAAWPSIGLRILASWLLAITIMMLAFTWR